jgi:hypothetical protein
MWKRWREVDEPAARRVQNLFNYLLLLVPISVRWNPLGPDTGKRLKHGAAYGSLLGVRAGGRIWRVKPEGYKRAQDFHAGFWEPLFPEQKATQTKATA